ncbi:MAG: HAMP domain-containing sensor histidine kinase [Bacteroidota bacterium]
MKDTELIRKNKQIIELQNVINDLNKKLNESESLKSNFISNIMNEMYNPFSSIISIADNIQSLKVDQLQKALPMAEIIYREAAQLDFHLQNIFAAASIEAGLEVLDLANVNIANIFTDILVKFKVDISNKNLKITSNLTSNNEINFVTDSKKLTLILLNLLSNSVKYSPDAGTIDFKFEIIEDCLNISISDEGVGMTDVDIKNIYNRFSRVDTTINSVIGGTGLGLSIVKALIEILNANINISSTKGTKIYLAIPKIEIDDEEIMSDEEIF